MKKALQQVLGALGVVTPAGAELCTAATRGDTPTVARLIKEGVAVDMPGGKGITSLFYGERSGGSGHDATGWTALMLASWEGHTEIVRQLLDAGANVNFRVRIATPLYLAAQRGNVELMRLLLERGAKLQIAHPNGSAPVLTAAAHSGKVEAVRLLLDAGEDVNAASDSGHTALMGATNFGHADIVRLLLERGADLLQRDCHGLSPLYNAIYYAVRETPSSPPGTHRAVLAVMLETNPPLDIHAAAALGDIPRVRQLLGEGVSVNLEDRYKHTPLYHALVAGETETVAVLLEQGGTVAPSQGGALRLAAEYGRTETVAFLLNTGETTQDDKGKALVAAVRSNNTETVRLLLKSGVDINAEGLLPLHWALNLSQYDMLRLLLESGAEVDRPREDGSTALMDACHEEDTGAMFLLLKFGADPLLPNNEGLTALRIAEEEYGDESPTTRMLCRAIEGEGF
jgi:ankyrin repeat protein